MNLCHAFMNSLRSFDGNLNALERSTQPRPLNDFMWVWWMERMAQQHWSLRRASGEGEARSSAYATRD